MLGWLAGDRSAHSSGRQVQFKSNDEEKDILNEISETLSSYGYRNKVYKPKGHSSCSEILLSSTQFSGFLKEIGADGGCYTKSIPSCILESPQSVKKAYLRYLFTADGFLGLRTRKQIHNVSGKQMYRTIKLDTHSKELSIQV